LAIAVRARDFIDAVRQTEIARHDILDDFGVLERVVAAAVAGVPARVTHSY
jgi:hypothetical protein